MNNSSQAIAILSLVVAILAVFVGPLLTLHIGRKQIELSRRIASKQIVAPMRQAWINNFREKLAELSSNALHTWNAGFEGRNDGEHKRLVWLQEEIKLLINPAEEDHTALIVAIDRMVGALERGIDDFDEFVRARDAMTGLGQKIFKTEWSRIKGDIEKP